MTDGTTGRVMRPAGLQTLIECLAAHGYTVIGPTPRDGVIAYDRVSGLADLPVGWTDEQAGGHYRLRRRTDEAVFGYAVGPQARKRYLHPPAVTLWRARAADDGLRFEPGEDTPPPRYAFLGVRACELNAIRIQDRVFLAGDYVDPLYRERREGAFIIAVNCAVVADTCFCVAMGSGPEAGPGYDLRLTELMDDAGHRFLVEAGSAAGEGVMTELDTAPAMRVDRDAARGVVRASAASMGRTMPDTDVPALLARNLEHPRWDEVAGRCLTCGNCTQVCPTCFCTSVEDTSDLTGTTATRTRRWDSCFTLDFSYLHGGSVRQSGRSRYRQWLTHKLSTWVDQFGTSGCVGCGRCIAWCPVGIDLTEEVAAIHASDGAGGGQ